LISKKDSAPVEKLQEIIEFQVDFLSKNKSLPRILFSDELHINNPELRATIMERHKKFIHIISITLKECIEQGVFRKDLDLNMAAKTVFGLIQTTMFMASLSDFKENLSDQGTRIFKFLEKTFTT